MTAEGQDIDRLFQGEDIDITVTLTGVTLDGSESLEATFRDKASGAVVLTVTTADGITITAPATVTIALTSAQTGALRGSTATSKPTHDWSLWRVDDSANEPYSIGTVTVVDTSRA